MSQLWGFFFFFFGVFFKCLVFNTSEEEQVWIYHIKLEERCPGLSWGGTVYLSVWVGSGVTQRALSLAEGELWKPVPNKQRDSLPVSHSQMANLGRIGNILYNQIYKSGKKKPYTNTITIQMPCGHKLSGMRWQRHKTKSLQNGFNN